MRQFNLIYLLAFALGTTACRSKISANVSGFKSAANSENQEYDSKQKENSTPTTLSSTAFAVLSNTNLGSCDASRNLQLIYDLEKNLFRICRDGIWQEIDLRGPKGLDGTNGLPGAAGPVGQKGAEGSQGPSGPQGSQGPSGPQGSQGPGIDANDSYVWAYVSTTPTISAGVDTKILFNSEDADKKNEFDITTGVFTALAAGMYRVELNVRTANVAWSSTSQYIQTSIFLNNATLLSLSRNVIGTNVSQRMTNFQSVTVELLPGDTLDARIYSTQANPLEGGAKSNVYLIITKVR